MRFVSASFVSFSLAWTASALAVSNATSQNITHGAYLEYNGVPMRYHQIFRGVMRGIPVSEWDDAIHVPNDTELDLSNAILNRTIDTSKFSTVSNTTGVDERSLREDICQVATTCTNVVLAGSTVALQYTWQAILTAVETANNNRPDLWKFINKPFFTSLAVAAGSAGTWTSWATSQAGSQTSTVSSCSTTNSEIDVAASILAQVVGQNPTSNCISVNLTLPNGQQGNMSICSFPSEQQGQCGAPDTYGAEHREGSLSDPASFALSTTVRSWTDQTQIRSSETRAN